MIKNRQKAEHKAKRKRRKQGDTLAKIIRRNDL